MGRAKKNPMRSYLAPALFTSSDSEFVITLFEFMLVGLVINQFLQPREPWESEIKILGISIDCVDYLLPPFIQSTSWKLYLLHLVTIYPATLIVRPWLRSYQWYLYWLSGTLLYNFPLGQQWKAIINLNFSVIGSRVYLLGMINAIHFYNWVYRDNIHPNSRGTKTESTPKFPNLRKMAKHCSAEALYLFFYVFQILCVDFFNDGANIKGVEYHGILSSFMIIFLVHDLTYLLIRKCLTYSKPRFLEMVRWYSGTSAGLYKTIYDLMVSVNIFQGRFDLRILQAAMNQAQNGAQQENLLHDHFSGNEELWFDFMADTGDGGNSTYTVARLLAEPHIGFATHGILKRGDLLLIGGDLAYPNPSKSTYEKRLFRPFEYALEKPVNYDQEDHRDRPQCFVIPGNHDWFDGLGTFTKYICEKRWLGGWYMPQKTSYFALKLPKNWWIFGLDLALDGDIDTYQFQFFSNLAREQIEDNDSVIVMTHQPDWLVDWYEGGTDVDRENLSNLICNVLKERCRLRIAGDIHHYMRHSSTVGSNCSVNAQHLLVNGCGGAFAHPTHVFSGFKESHRVTYKCEACYPDKQTSWRLGFKNILHFRKENSQFDIVGGIVYYMLTFSMVPQCDLHHIFEVDSSILGFLMAVFRTLWNGFIYMLEYSYVSLGAVMLLLIVAFAFVPSKVPWKKRVAMAILHVSAHLVAALFLMLALELVVELLAWHKRSTTSGYEHSLHHQHYELPKNGGSLENSGTIAWIDIWLRRFLNWCVEKFMLLYKVPELMAIRSNICKNGMASLSRFETIGYYLSVFFYFFFLSTSTVSYVFGFYLCICVNVFNLHYDEAFSSLRIADYKGFTRFHITSDGDLEVFTLAVDKVPTEWWEDRDWQWENKIDPNRSSHKRWFPSKWSAHSWYKDPLQSVKIIDHFVIGRAYRPQHNTSEIEEPTS